jgi:hypothetical protein
MHMDFPFTRAQKAEIEALVAQGWPRAAAELVVLESQEDVVEDTPESRRSKPCAQPWEKMDR